MADLGSEAMVMIRVDFGQTGALDFIGRSSSERPDQFPIHDDSVMLLNPDIQDIRRYAKIPSGDLIML